jgi:LPXTG-site transpeptidase (sortase) family protein
VRGRLSAAAGGCVIAAGVFVAIGLFTPPATALRAPGPSPSVAAQPAAQPSLGTDPNPARLMIPAIGVDATIEPRGLDSNRDLATAADYRNVAWYDLGPRPGDPGNAILNGHVSWWTGDAVFTRLAQVRAGDVIRVIRADHVAVTFKVTGTQVVDANSRIAALFAQSSRSTLTLITCTGAWNPLTQSDTRRLLVSASLV